jgi:hypothetical protein
MECAYYFDFCRMRLSIRFPPSLHDTGPKWLKQGVIPLGETLAPNLQVDFNMGVRECIKGANRLNLE